MGNQEAIIENERLEFIQSLELLDTLPEGEFDILTQLASKFLKAPVSLFSIVDKNRQWFKSRVGFEPCETPRDISFCSHAITQSDIFIVEDADTDPLFSDNPLVTTKTNPVKFYSGVPIVIHGKYPIGTLCIIDHIPRVLSEEEKEILISLGKQVEKLIELRITNLKVEKQRNELSKQHSRLQEFAGVISHDMKMPLANLIITSDILKKKYAHLLDKEGFTYLEYLKNSSLTLSDYIGNILKYYETEGITGQEKTTFDVYELLEEIIELLQLTENSNIALPEDNLILHSNKAALEQVFLNLITNALKYNDKEIPEIEIECSEDKVHYHFSVIDNGMGIDEKNIALIFDLYENLGNVDNKGNKGHGIGLSMIKKICANLGGDIKVSSEIGKGTQFDFWIEK